MKSNSSELAPDLVAAPSAYAPISVNPATFFALAGFALTGRATPRKP